MGISVGYAIIIFNRLNYSSLIIVAVSIVVGIVSYLFISFLLKNESFSIVRQVLLKKF